MFERSELFEAPAELTEAKPRKEIVSLLARWEWSASVTSRSKDERIIG
jgi:hypothetical protein